MDPKDIIDRIMGMGVSQYEISKRTGLQQSHLSRMRRDGTKRPSMPTVGKLKRLEAEIKREQKHAGKTD